MLKCRGMGKAMKTRYADGGEVAGPKPNITQRSLGTSLMNRDEQRKRAAIDDAMGMTNELPRVTGESPPIKRRVVDPATKAKQDAQLKALLKKQDAPM